MTQYQNVVVIRLTYDFPKKNLIFFKSLAIFEFKKFIYGKQCIKFDFY